jgi:diguanylate cyclase
VHGLHGQDGDMLMRRADAAMYTAKRNRAGHALATIETEQPAADRLALTGALRSAIDRGQLILHYQAIVESESEQIVDMETLVRWQHPAQRLIPPDRFISLALGDRPDHSANALGRKDRPAAVSRWQARGRHIRVTVNLSAHDVQDLALPDRVVAQLAESGVAPDMLTLELT